MKLAEKKKLPPPLLPVHFFLCLLSVSRPPCDYTRVPAYAIRRPCGYACAPKAHTQRPWNRQRGGLKERRGCKERDGSEGGFCNFNRLVHVRSWWWHDGFWTFSQVHIKDLDSHFFSLRTQMRISTRLRTQMVTSLVRGPNRGSIKSLRT